MARRPIDIVLLTAILILLLFGICFVFTASSAKAERDFGDSAFYLKKQLLRVAIGLFFMLLVLRLDYHHWLRLAPPFYWITLALLIVLMFAPESWAIRGSRRWLMLGPFQVQPSEMAKFGLIFYLAANLTKPRLDLREMSDGLMPQLVLTGAVVLAVALEPDMGTALLIAAISLCLLFVRGARLGHLFLILSAGVLSALALTWKVAYQRGRVESFIETLAGKAEPAWQVQQSLIGLGNGGLTGLGLGQSKQRLMFLPDPFTDFIMSIVGEELGVIGTLTVLTLFFIVLWRGFRIVRRAPDDFGKLLAFGITCAIGLNAFINIAVVTNLLPTTGIPLPFLSYGGSSLIMNLIAIGVLLNISQHCRSGRVAASGLVRLPVMSVRWYRDRNP